MKKIVIIFLLLFSGLGLFAQTETAMPNPPDTAIEQRSTQIDTANISSIVADTLSSIINQDTLLQASQPKVYAGMDTFYLKMVNNPFLKMTGKPVYLVISERTRETKDDRFYLIAGILLFLGFLKNGYSKYFNNIFRLFFQANFRQKQTREQAAHNNLPALFFNILFILSGATFVAVLFSHFNWINAGFWWIFFAGFITLMIIYLGKYMVITFAGWVFNVKEAAETYVFVVNLVNKILGVVLIPFTLLIAFTFSHMVNVIVTISLLLIGSLFVYRYLMSYSPVRKSIKLNPLHFFLYIIAFEVIPLLLISKSIMIYLNNSL